MAINPYRAFGAELATEGVGEVYEKYKSGTAEILSSPERVDKIKSRKSPRCFNGGRKSDSVIVP